MKIREDLERIKLVNPKDYKNLLLLAHRYCENRDAETPNKEYEARLLEAIKSILDDYHIHYVDDLTGAEA